MLPQRILWFLNPDAGGGRAETRLHRFLQQRGQRADDVALIRSPAEASSAIATMAADTVVVAAGGDGTAAMVASALHGCGREDTAMALFPLGTGNILARTLGVGSPRLALRALDQGRIRQIDLMRTSHAWLPIALVSISAGFEDRFLAAYARYRSYGRALGGLMGALAARRVRDISLTLDGVTLVQHGQPTFSAGLYNTPFYAGGLLMSPRADVADGWGEATVYWTAAAYWNSLWSGLRAGARQTGHGVLRRKWQTASIASDAGLQIDGESASAGVVTVSLEAGALSVYTLPDGITVQGQKQP